MPGTFFGFNTALRGMQGQQRGMYTTSHNIANANTDGYTRQRVVLATMPAYPVPSMNHPGGSGWQIGTGVFSQETRRLRDQFLDSQIRRETGSLGLWEQKQDILKQVEIVFNEPSDTGFNTLLSQFWASWQELAKYAESSPIRTTVVETSVALAEAFNHSAQQLETITADIEQTIALKVTEINSLAQQIADLNGQIKNIVAAGDQPNDLMDQRDLLLDRLSKIIDFTVEENVVDGKADGKINVLVNDIDITAVDSDKKIINIFSTGSTDILLNNSGVTFARGEIKGLQDAHKDVQLYLDKLDILARGLAENINAIHRQGNDLNGDPVHTDEPPNIDTYENFFVVLSNPPDISATDITAKNIGVNPNIQADVTKIAAAESNGGEGDGANALKIAQLQSKLLQETDNDGDEITDTLTIISDGSSGGVTFDDYYKNFTARLGVDAHEAVRMTTNQGVLVDQLTNRKESISGVSLDEEMATMIQYQRAYEASARMITTLDSMLDKIINGMGVTR